MALGADDAAGNLLADNDVRLDAARCSCYSRIPL
jgi:hypothetical protein